MSGFSKDDLSSGVTTGKAGASKRTQLAAPAHATLPGVHAMSETNSYFDPAFPQAHGLYDPANEKDSCRRRLCREHAQSQVA